LNVFKAAVVYFILLAAVAHLIFFHFAPDAPVWQNRSVNSQQLSLERGLVVMDNRFLDDAGGGNLELHFRGFDTSDVHQALAMAKYYFRANYALYPHRALIGHDDRLLSDAPQMTAADVVPDDDWLRQHDVHTVLTLTKLEDREGVYPESRPVN
jgi:hypothetical protein